MYKLKKLKRIKGFVQRDPKIFKLKNSIKFFVFRAEKMYWYNIFNF